MANVERNSAIVIIVCLTEKITHKRLIDKNLT